GSKRSLARHLNRGIDGIFEIVGVVGPGLVSIAEGHAIVAGAHLAQGEPEMARNRFGFLQRHGASIPISVHSASWSLCPDSRTCYFSPKICSSRPWRRFPLPAVKDEQLFRPES